MNTRVLEPDDMPEADDESPMKANITVGLLTAVEENSIITQRSLARRLGIALGLTNVYLKRCVNKGLIKIAQAPANRYRYYLTPKGFSEKSRLTANYLTYSFSFLRQARAEYEGLFRHCEEKQWRRIAFCGSGELVDIALLAADGRELVLLGLITAEESHHLRLPVARDIATFAPVDAVILADYRAPQASFDRMIDELPEERVLAPRLLNVSRQKPRFAT